MEAELLEKWRRIYTFTDEIAGMNPWALFSEKDIVGYIPKESQEEHYFMFFGQQSGETVIAVYQDANAYFSARARMLGPNPKKEPVSLLQDAIVFRLGDRQDVSKTNYEVIKGLNIPCRGKGSWPFFQRYRVGYFPDDVPVEALDTLLDDMGSLMMMVKAVTEGSLKDQLGQGKVMMRTYSPENGMFYNYFVNLRSIPKPRYPAITINENEWLRQVRAMVPRGTLQADWSYLSTVMKNGREKIIPRLFLAVDARSGFVAKATAFSPSEDPCEDLLMALEEIIREVGKPAVIELCDDEMESGLTDLCAKAGIRLVKKKQLKQLSMARRDFLRTWNQS